MGETGVGKSTWINAIANDFKYSTLDDAEKHGTEWLIPSTFQIPTRDIRDYITVAVGTQVLEEVYDVKQGTTQFPCKYVIEYSNTIF